MVAWPLKMVVSAVRQRLEVDRIPAPVGRRRTQGPTDQFEPVIAFRYHHERREYIGSRSESFEDEAAEGR
jgi:hypothetical protein